MKALIGPLLRAMHRLAKEHNQAPAAGLLSAKADQPAGLQPTEATHGSGSWFMWNALNGEASGLTDMAAGCLAPCCLPDWLPCSYRRTDSAACMPPIFPARSRLESSSSASTHPSASS